jgi:hypothetical protein
MGGARTKRTVATLFLAVAVVGVGSGCGGGSHTNANSNLNAGLTPYEKAMLRLGSTLNATLTSVGAADRTATGPKPIERNLAKSQVELRAAAAKLEKIVPPAKIKADHERLIKGVLDYANELNAVIANLKKGGGPKALGVIPNLKGLREMALATGAITKAGYIITITSS